MVKTHDILELAQAEQKQALRSFLLHLECWHAFTGHGGTIELALGDMLKRQRELKNMTLPAEYRKHEGTSNLLVWCSWRLQHKERVLCTSDWEPADSQRHCRRLKGARVQAVEIGAYWDLSIRFEKDWSLITFSDHIGPAANIDTNWEIWRPDKVVFVDSDLSFRQEPRDYPPAQRQARRRVREAV